MPAASAPAAGGAAAAAAEVPAEVSLEPPVGSAKC